MVKRSQLAIYDELYRVCCSVSPHNLDVAGDRFATIRNLVNFCYVSLTRES